MKDRGPDPVSGPCLQPAAEPLPVRVRLDVAYVGGDFFGWQIQPGLRTVQGVLRQEVSRLLGYQATVVGAGRTDAGVHARGQVAHLDVRTVQECERLRRILPAAVPADIAIKDVRRVSGAFNARLSALWRRYSYHLLLGRDIFQPHVWRIEPPLDRTAMEAAAAMLRGRHDFSSFCKTASLKDDGNACTVDVCGFEWHGDRVILHIRADRFLHHMVRTIAGTLVEIGRGRRSAQDIPEILAARNRCRAGGMAPACGLFLEEVAYPPSLLVPEEGGAP